MNEQSPADSWLELYLKQFDPETIKRLKTGIETYFQLKEIEEGAKGGYNPNKEKVRMVVYKEKPDLPSPGRSRIATYLAVPDKGFKTAINERFADWLVEKGLADRV